MITSTRSQLGKLLIDNPDVIIHNSCLHTDKRKETQKREYEAVKGIVKYAMNKNKHLIFISTTGKDTYYSVYKKLSEQYIMSYMEKRTIIRFPSLISKGTLWEKFYTGEYTEAQGNDIMFLSLEEAANIVNEAAKNPIRETITIKGNMIKDFDVMALAKFYKELSMKNGL